MDATLLSRWRGRAAFVTGASTGIGRAIAGELARLGLRVAVSARRAEWLETVAAEIRRHGSEAKAFVGDHRDPAFTERCFHELAADWQGVDVLVNNVGARGGRSLLQASWDEIDAAFDLNLRVPVQAMRLAAAQLRSKTEGAILTITSMAAHRVVPGTPAVYAATKHALRIVTDGLRNELLAEGLNVKVASISPGLVDTPWHAQPGGLLTTQGAFSYAPLAPQDIAATVRYILSTPPSVQVCDVLLRPHGQPF